MCHLFIYVHGSTVTSMTYRKPAQQNKKNKNHSIPLVPTAVSAFIPLIRTQDVQGWMNRKDLHVTKVMPTGEREPFAYVKYVELGSSARRVKLCKTWRKKWLMGEKCR